MQGEHQEIALIVDRIRDIPTPSMHGLIEFLGTGAEIIGSRVSARAVQPVGREGGVRSLKFGVLQGVSDGQAYPQQLGTRLVHV